MTTAGSMASEGGLRAEFSPASAPAQTRAGWSRYRRLLTLGSGGMGTVEVALEQGDAQADAGSAAGGRVVALKHLLPERARDTRAKDMFLREARVAALIDHPNVVHALDFGEERGELFIAMDYVEGEPLSRVLAAVRERREPLLDPALVAGLLAEVCEGLHAAHELRDAQGSSLNVVHRDVSPQNVMVAYAGHAKVLDFGVAKFELDAGSVRTRTGEVKGKMAYMSPEQALGDSLDRRADLFGVGAVLFECLAGKRMWGDGTDLDVMRKLALEQPPRLDTVAHGVPAALVELHARLVSRDPSARPATAREVAEALRAVAPPENNAAAVRALMLRLFPGEEAARRKLLSDALAHVDPARAELRETAVAQSGDLVAIVPGRKGRPWVGVIAVAIVAVVVAGAMRATRGARASESDGANAGANAGAAANEGANAGAGEGEGAGANEGVNVSVTASAVGGDVGAGASAGVVAKPRKAGRPVLLKANQAAKPPDVDPAPF